MFNLFKKDKRVQLTLTGDSRGWPLELQAILKDHIENFLGMIQDSKGDEITGETIMYYMEQSIKIPLNDIDNIYMGDEVYKVKEFYEEFFHQWVARTLQMAIDEVAEDLEV